MSEYINSTPLWAILGFLLILLPLSIEFGYRIARIYGGKSSSYALTETIPASILGVHALLIGFTFSMSIARYESRRELVVKEANAIGTAFLRAQTLPAPYSKRLSHLLVAYTEDKVKFGKIVHGQADTKEILERISKNQNTMWTAAQEMTVTLRSPVEALFLLGLNEVIDVHSERVHAIRNQLPWMVLFLLLFTLVISLVSFGYVDGIKHRRSGFWLFTMSVLFAGVIALIIDMDRPRRGLIQVSQAPIEELYQDLRSKLSY